MITKRERNLIQQLRLKKNRLSNAQFVVEGVKSVKEFIDAGYNVSVIYATEEFHLPQVKLISSSEMERISHFKNASPVLAVFSIPNRTELPKNGRILVLDTITDPGNMGTLIRLADWYGINHVVCSMNTVDCYNPKVVQSTMGSLARVSCHYKELTVFLEQNERPSFGAFLEGDSIYNITLPENALLVLGSESHGISQEVKKELDNLITIPRTSTNGPESLNVAIAGGIIMGELCR